MEKSIRKYWSVFLLPTFAAFAIGFIWQILLNGVLTNLGLPLLALNATYGFWGLIILMCWQQIGYMMIIYIAGLAVFMFTGFMKSVPLAIQYFRGSYGRVEMGPMMACIMITVLPVIVMYLLCQKYIIESVIAGAVKG